MNYRDLKPHEAVMIAVFVDGPGGGNLVPLVADAHGMGEDAMLGVARRHGYESVFILPATRPDCDLRLRYFVPAHEMEMCGHATVGALWALRQWRRWSADTARVETASGVVEARWDHARQAVWISQPGVRVQMLGPDDRRTVARVLGARGTLDEVVAYDMANASTSRVKTLIHVPDRQVLDTLRPDFARMQAACEAIDSTGLYPYALDGDAGTMTPPRVYARQFPRASGYPEDAATGIAAAALWGYLIERGVVQAGSEAVPIACSIMQGHAMGSPSEILLMPRWQPGHGLIGCWLTGAVEWRTGDTAGARNRQAKA